jgi:hypothetical protein
VLAGRITEVGEDYLILGGGTSRILLVEGLASYFQVDQQVTITAVMAADGSPPARSASPALDHVPFGPRGSMVSGRQRYVVEKPAVILSVAVRRVATLRVTGVRSGRNRCSLASSSRTQSCATV